MNRILVALSVSLFLLPVAPTQAQADPLFRAVMQPQANRDVLLKWPKKKGYLYEVERTSDLSTWTKVGFTFYGNSNSTLGDLSTYEGLKVFTLPVPPPGGGPPVPPPAEPLHRFFVRRDGANTLVSWYRPTSPFGLVRAYVNQDWRFQQLPPANLLLMEFKTFRIAQNGPAYLLSFWPLDGQALPSPLPNNADLTAADQVVLAKFTAGLPEVTASLENPPVTQPGPSVQNAPGPKDFFRVRELGADTDADGILDSHEFTLGLSPVSPDSDGDGVQDPWDGLAADLVVSEYQANNKATLPDNFGNYSDWLEILNPTTSPISLDNYYLTDKPLDLTQLLKWKFPTGLTIAPGQTLLVWASGLDDTDIAQPLHTNFELNQTNEGIGISKKVGMVTTLLDYHRWTSPEVQDRSGGWGVDNWVPPADGRTRKVRYFVEPTPGALNIPRAYVGACASPYFSTVGGIFVGAGFSVSITPAPTTTVHYTTDFTAPTESSPVATGAIPVSGNTIIRAIAVAPDCIPTPVISMSYLFKEKVLGTAPQGTLPTDYQVKPAAYPEATSQSPYVIDYALNPQVIQANKTALMAQLSEIPTVSVVLPNDDFFNKDTHGVYANASISEALADPRDLDWKRTASVEYYPTSGQSSQETGLLSVAGGISIYPSATPKHSLKIDFRQRVSGNPEGVMDFSVPPFVGSTIDKFRTLMLRNPAHDSWALRQPHWAITESTYVKEAWARGTHAEMGHLIAHRQWVHLYINGLYWGIYEFGERVNQDFLRSYSGNTQEYDVIKQAQPGPDEQIEDGDDLAWEELKVRAAAAGAAPTDAAKWTKVTEMLDVDNYIDYLMVNMYAHNLDWPTNNWRAARRKDRDNRTDLNNIIYASGQISQRFRFFVWDAEMLFGQGALNLDITDYNLQVTQFHGALLNHPSYQAAWKARVALHIDSPTGVFGVSGAGVQNAVTRWTTETTAFDSCLLCEEARWADTVSSTYGRTHWLSSIAARQNWITSRRAIFRAQLQARGLAD